MLSQTQKNFFDSQGYLVLEKLFSTAQIDALKKGAAGIIADFDIDKNRTVFSTSDKDAGRDDYFYASAEAVHCFLEEGALDSSGDLVRPKELAINKIGHAMHDLVPEFKSFCLLPVIGQVLRDIGYHEPVLWQSMYIFKQPGIGGEVRWHQDASYLHASPGSVTGLWVAVEEATKANGCLWMLPGQHKSSLREKYSVDWQTREGHLQSLDEEPWSGKDAVALEVPAGSVVLFHDHMPHYSAPNLSDDSRHAFTMHVAEKEDEWPATNWLQRPELGFFEL